MDFHLEDEDVVVSHLEDEEVVVVVDEEDAVVVDEEEEGMFFIVLVTMNDPMLLYISNPLKTSRVMAH